MIKSTSKIRNIFDCSAKCNGISLNDVIHVGPKLQKELFHVLIHFPSNQSLLFVTLRRCTSKLKLKLGTVHCPEFYGGMLRLTMNQMSMSSVEWCPARTRRQWKHSLLHRRVPECRLQKLFVSPPAWMTPLTALRKRNKVLSCAANLRHYGRRQTCIPASGFPFPKKVIAATPLEDHASEVNIKDYKDAVTTTLGLQWNSIEDIFVIPAT